MILNVKYDLETGEVKEISEQEILPEDGYGIGHTDRFSWGTRKNTVLRLTAWMKPGVLSRFLLYE